MKRTIKNWIYWGALIALLPAFSWGALPAGAATKVTLVQPVDVLSFAPIAVARKKGFFKQEGIDLDFVIIRGGPASAAAFIAGDVQFLTSGSFSPVQLVAKGKTDVMVVNAFARALTFQVVASNRWLKKANLKPGASPVEKLRAMKGATFGAPSFGGLSEHVIRYYLQHIGGLAKRDFSIVAVGFGAAMIASMEKGQIDGLGASPPVGPAVVRRGFGQILLSGWDIPHLGNMVYETLTTSTGYAKANPDAVRKVTRAVARGTNYIPNNTDGAIQVLQAHYKRMDPKMIAKSVRMLIPAFGGSGRMTEEMWANAMKLWRATSLKKDVPFKEGSFWTNRYIVNVPKD